MPNIVGHPDLLIQTTDRPKEKKKGKEPRHRELFASVLIIIIFLWTVLFWGSPDIVDGIIHRLMYDGPVAAEKP